MRNNILHLRITQRISKDSRFNIQKYHAYEDITCEATNNQANIINQMLLYLKGKITIEKYFDTVAPFFTEYAVDIINTDFYEIFSNNVPDVCLYFIEKSGGTKIFEQNFSNAL